MLLPKGKSMFYVGPLKCDIYLSNRPREKQLSISSPSSIPIKGDPSMFPRSNWRVPAALLLCLAMSFSLGGVVTATPPAGEKTKSSLKLTAVDEPGPVFVSEPVHFKVQVAAKGFNGKTVKVQLLGKNAKGKRKLIDRRVVEFSKDKQTIEVDLGTRPQKVGKLAFVIEASLAPDKKAKAITRVKLNLTVKKAKLVRILYIVGPPRYEYRFLREILERNKAIELKVLFTEAVGEVWKSDKIALKDFPTKKELRKFDVVIVGDVDPKSKKLGKKHFAELASFVQDRGGALLMIAGSHFTPHAYKNTPLADVMPVVPEKGKTPAEPSARKTGYRLVLTPRGQGHVIFQFGTTKRQNVKIVKSLQPMYWWARDFIPTPKAVVLATHPTEELKPTKKGQKSRLVPLVLLQNVGKGRCLFFGMDATWRWRYRTDLIHYERFWLRTVRFLAG